MLLNHSFINALLGTKIVSTSLIEDFSPLIYIPKLRLFCRKDFKQEAFNILGVKSCFRFSFKAQHTPYFLKSNYLFLNSVNGIIIIDLHRLVIYKCLDSKLESNFIENETIASSYYPNITPCLVDAFKFDNYNITLHKFISNANKVTGKNWAFVFDKIIKIYFSKNNFPKSYNSCIYLEEINSSLKSLSNNIFFKIDHNRIYNLFRQLFKKFNSSLQIYKCFVHGDLVPNNVLNVEHNYFLIDFANGGFHPITYDLMMQDFYNPKSFVWKNFFNINFIGNRDIDVFSGLSHSFLSIFSNNYQIRLDENSVKLMIIISFAEKYIKSNLRYQSNDYKNDGLKILKIIEVSLKNILNSF